MKRLIAQDKRYDALDDFATAYDQFKEQVKELEEAVSDFENEIRRHYDKCYGFLKTTVDGNCHEDMSDDVEYYKEMADEPADTVAEQLARAKDACHKLFESYGSLVEDVSSYNKANNIKKDEMSEEERKRLEEENEREVERIMKRLLGE